ncbi:hypothetical protein [Globicatella sanguinis]
MTCLRPTQLCGGGQTKRKSTDFRLLAHSQEFKSVCSSKKTERRCHCSFMSISYRLIHPQSTCSLSRR